MPDSFSNTAISFPVTVIIPVYQEAGSITSTIQAVQALGSQWEVLVVDDGSTDGSFEAAEKAGARVIRHRENRGYGAALKTGIRHVNTEWVAILDADGTYPVAELPRLAKAVRDRDMVVGARTSADAQIPLIRRPAKWVLRKLAEFLVEAKIPDLNSGMRLMRRELVEQFFPLLPNGFSFTTTITLGFLSNSYPIEFVEIPYHKRAGRSKIQPFRDTLNFLILIVRMSVLFNPLRFFLPLALGVLAVALGLLGIDLFVYHDITDSTTLFFLTALQIGLLGILADAIASRDKFPRS